MFKQRPIQSLSPSPVILDISLIHSHSCTPEQIAYTNQIIFTIHLQPSNAVWWHEGNFISIQSWTWWIHTCRAGRHVNWAAVSDRNYLSLSNAHEAFRCNFFWGNYMCEVSGNEFWKLCLFKVAIRKCSSRQDVQRSSWKSLGGHTLK